MSLSRNCLVLHLTLEFMIYSEFIITKRVLGAQNTTLLNGRRKADYTSPKVCHTGTKLL